MKVVLVRTRGPSAWLAAERRLAAELRALRMQVYSAPLVRELDPLLPQRAQEYDAFVAVQVLREQDRGVIRLWFAEQKDQRSGYQHLQLNLRNADVVSRAVLPVVETIFDRTQTPPAVDGSNGARALTDNDSLCSGRGAHLCNAALGLRFGVGPWVVTATRGTSFGGMVGARVGLLPGLKLDNELSYQAFTRNSTAESLSSQFVLRSHLVLEAWSREGRGAGVGPGIGVLRATSPTTSVGYYPMASLRAFLFAPVAPRLNLVVGGTVARGYGLPSEVPNRGWFADVMVALDWYVWL